MQIFRSHTPFCNTILSVERIRKKLNTIKITNQATYSYERYLYVRFVIILGGIHQKRPVKIGVSGFRRPPSPGSDGRP